MTEADPQPPLSPDPPDPPGGHVEAPDIDVEPPDDRDTPDGTAVSSEAGAVEAPD
jgi:hypothetical protein